MTDILVNKFLFIIMFIAYQATDLDVLTGSTEKINFQKIWVQIWCICPTHVCVSVDHLIGLEVRMNRSTVKIVSFFVNSQDNAVKWVEGF